jgi:hypothetical protein
MRPWPSHYFLDFFFAFWAFFAMRRFEDSWVLSQRECVSRFSSGVRPFNQGGVVIINP